MITIEELTEKLTGLANAVKEIDENILRLSNQRQINQGAIADCQEWIKKIEEKKAQLKPKIEEKISKKSSK